MCLMLRYWIVEPETGDIHQYIIHYLLNVNLSPSFKCFVLGFALWTRDTRECQTEFPSSYILTTTGKTDVLQMVSSSLSLSFSAWKAVVMTIACWWLLSLKYYFQNIYVLHQLFANITRRTFQSHEVNFSQKVLDLLRLYPFCMAWWLIVRIDYKLQLELQLIIVHSLNLYLLTYASHPNWHLEEWVVKWTHQLTRHSTDE